MMQRQRLEKLDFTVSRKDLNQLTQSLLFYLNQEGLHQQTGSSKKKRKMIIASQITQTNVNQMCDHLKYSVVSWSAVKQMYQINLQTNRLIVCYSHCLLI